MNSQDPVSVHFGMRAARSWSGKFSSRARAVCRASHRSGWVRAWALLCFSALTSLLVAQQLGVTKGFKVLGDTFQPPHDTQPRSLLQAATARMLTNSHYLLTGLRLETFRETGQREMLIEAKDCLFSAAAKSASSPGPLRVQTADGKFVIEGDGFLWLQPESNLTISNNVHTTIAADILSRPDEARKTPQPKIASSPVEILSETFTFSRTSNVSLYRGNVRVYGTNQASLKSELLEVKLPINERKLESLRALENVRMEYGDSEATGQDAFYSPNTGIVTLKGKPAWRVGQREGRAEELTVDPTNRIFLAVGNAWFKTPAHGLALSGLLDSSASVSAPSLKSRKPAAAGRAVDENVEIWSQAYEFRTNLAVFERDVRLKQIVEKQVRGTIDCGLLSATFRGSNDLDTITARTNVAIREGTNWLTCASAVLTGSNGILEATGSPAWGAGSRSGKGQLVRINTRANEMLVRGNASLEVPAGELSDASFVPGRTNSPSALRLGTNGIAQIFSEEYTLRPESADFKGGVYATHPRMNWACESLTMQFPRAPGAKQTLNAERGVKFQIGSPNGGQVEGLADKASYVYGVEGSVTNDLLTLNGSPATLRTTNGIVRNQVIIYDRVRNILRTPGQYSITGTNKLAETNLLLLPKGRGNR